MTTPAKRWLLDTNVWIFGLRRDANFPACAELLDQIGSFAVIIPRQVLKELTARLSESETRDFYRLINNYSDCIEVDWSLAPAERIKFYQEHGCRKGDAVIAAQAEGLDVSVIVSENRQFLQTLFGASIEISSPELALQRLISE